MGFSGNCYQWNSQKLTWSAAEQFCNSQEAHLVSIHSDPENNFVSYQVNPGKQRFWIGAQRKSPDSTLWIWTDGSSFDYQHFGPGKPDNYGGREACLDIGWSSRDTWDDKPCDQHDHHLPFVCKKTEI